MLHPTIAARVSSLALALVAVAGCTPSDEKACAHLQQLDDQEPATTSQLGIRVPRFGKGNVTPSCLRQLKELEAVDPAEHGSCVKCIMKATKWSDAWDCWVVDHLSKKQSDRIAALLKCDKSCEGAKTSCQGACTATDDGCRDQCMTTFEKCATGCQFD